MQANACLSPKQDLKSRPSDFRTNTRATRTARGNELRPPVVYFIRKLLLEHLISMFQVSIYVIQFKPQKEFYSEFLNQIYKKFQISSYLVKNNKLLLYVTYMYTCETLLN